jgi:hypothetical protein
MIGMRPSSGDFCAKILPTYDANSALNVRWQPRLGSGVRLL